MADCPSHEELERLLAEASSNDEERARVESHVEGCPDCQATLNELTLGGGGVAPPPAGTTDPAGGSTAERLFRRLKRMGPSPGQPEPPPPGPFFRADFANVDGYEILGELGRGATAVVYRARHVKLDRLVALKVIVAGPHLSPELRQRFRAEAHAIARLQHPNIVQIYDVGEHAGFPFLSLELMEGGNLSQSQGGKPRPPRDAARVIATLARAVAYAHGQGIVHRDLKPGNVLVNVAPGRPGKREFKITDFGIAKVLPRAGLDDAHVTQTGEILGTPAYMAPDQARGNAGEPGPATDVYSLGAMLYEMLTGRPPFQGATPVDTLMLAARQDPVSISLLVPRVPRDLNTICLKCLEKLPARRYPTANELAADLARFLKDEPILARPLSRAGLAARWVRRHRGLAAALSGIGVLLALLALVSLVASEHFRRLERQQRALATEKGELAASAESARQAAVRAERREGELRRVAEDKGRQLRQRLYFNQMILGSEAAKSFSGIGRVSEWLAPWADAGPDLRNWEWYYLFGLCHRDLQSFGHVAGVVDAAWSPDGKRVASAGSDCVVRIWDVAADAEVRRMPGHTREVISVAWSPDGARIASASFDGLVKVWSADTAEELLTFRGHASSLYAVAWSPDGARIASAGLDRTVQVWDARTGEPQFVLRGHTAGVFHVAWSPDGRQLASAGMDADVRTWDALAGTELRTLHGHVNLVRRVAWSPDGRRLASASNDMTAKVWDPATGQALKTLLGHGLGVSGVAWSPDGARLATCSDDLTLRVWSAADGAELFSLRGHVQPINSVAWSPDGTRLVSSSFDATLKLWDAGAGPEVVELDGRPSAVFAAAWSPDGQRLATGDADGFVKIWDAGQATPRLAVRGSEKQVRAVAWSPDGTLVASAGFDRAIRVWDVATGRQVNELKVDAEGTFGLSWSPDGRRLASAGTDRVLHVWDPLGVVEVCHSQGHGDIINAVAWSPDGTCIATGGADALIKLWDAVGGQELLSLGGHVSQVRCLAWSSDGKRLASGGDDQTARVWDPTTAGPPVGILRGHTTRVTGVAWSPDRTRLATCSYDRTVRLWDPATGNATLTLDAGGGVTSSIAWRPDGMTLAAASEGGRVRLFDPSSGYLAARAPEASRVIDRRLAADPTAAADWKRRAEIAMNAGDAPAAATAAERWLALDPAQRWLQLGYWVAGPYPGNLRDAHPPETAASPAQTASRVDGTGTDATVGWQFVPARGRGFLDFAGAIGRADNVSGYAMMRVYSRRSQRVAILVGADDQVRLWLNGRQAFEDLTAGRADPDAHAVAATLDVGWNTILARVVNLTGEHMMYLRLSAATDDLDRAARSP